EVWFEALKREQLEAARRPPRAGHNERGVDGQEYTWKEYHGEAPILDFNLFVGGVTEPSLAYAVCYVISDTEQHDLRLQVGTRRQAWVYLNGQRIEYYSLHEGQLWAMDELGPITLHQGTNTLVLKVGIDSGAEGCARIVDAEGNPAQGLQVRLTPE